jgi:hypothetical protein
MERSVGSGDLPDELIWVDRSMSRREAARTKEAETGMGKHGKQSLGCVKCYRYYLWSEWETHMFFGRVFRHYGLELLGGAFPDLYSG